MADKVLPQKILVTAALPYANGPVHIGHLAGAYLPADVFVRYCRLKGKDVLFICGTDEHGVPITLAAEKLKRKPLEYVSEIHNVIKEAFDAVNISFDNFSGTARPLHYKISSDFFLELNKRGFLEKKSVKQLYCSHCSRFLPDRYVEGECPICHKSGARGDQCESCGSDLDQIDLVSPSCKLCGNRPDMKDSFHWFLKLSMFEKALREWLNSKEGSWKENVTNFCRGLLNGGLPDRAITRDMDWGVPVPLPEGAGKVIYVWFDAPIGYISSTIEWAEKNGTPDAWRDYWLNPETALIHFIGKDNIVFHSIMWPAVLMGVGGYNLPTDIPANEFLNIEGNKVSTSRNYAIWIHDAVRDFGADALRWYISSIAPETKDADFSFREFQASNNGELADILGNFVNRTVTFIDRYFGGCTPDYSLQSDESAAMLLKINEVRTQLDGCFANYQLRKACMVIMEFCRDANRYFNDQAPWKSRKESIEKCASSLHVCLMIIRALSVFLSPIIPDSAKKMAEIFPVDVRADWSTVTSSMGHGFKLSVPPILFHKIEDAVIEESKGRLGAL